MVEGQANWVLLSDEPKTKMSRRGALVGDVDDACYVATSVARVLSFCVKRESVFNERSLSGSGGRGKISVNGDASLRYT